MALKAFVIEQVKFNGYSMRHYRYKAKMTLADLSRMTNIKTAVLSRYESGQNIPSVEKAICIALALGVNPICFMSFDYLYNLENPSIGE